MVNVQFEEPYTQTSSSRTKQESGMAGWLIQKGIAKNATQANLVLIALIIVLSVVMFLSLTSSSKDIDDIIVDPEFNLVPEADSV